jgi:hypothetical protein
MEDNVVSSFSNSSHFGIYGLGIRDFDMRNNRVRVAGPQGSIGIYLKNCGRFSRTSVLANNAVAMNLGTGIIAIGRGMWLIGCSDIQVLHNSVYHLSDDADNFAFAMEQSNDMTLLNNVFANGSAGRAFYSFGNSNLLSDHNVFFSKTGTLGETVNDLAGLQVLTGGDQHSVVGDPGWAAPEPDSLALRNAALENIGTATSITTDLLGRPRHHVRRGQVVAARVGLHLAAALAGGLLPLEPQDAPAEDGAQRPREQGRQEHEVAHQRDREHREHHVPEPLRRAERREREH